MYLIIVAVIVTLFCIFYAKKSKTYFADENGEKKEEDKKLKEIVEGIIRPTQYNLDNKIFVNGHFIKQTRAVVKVTTYTSYVILYDRETDEIELINYKNTGEAVSLGKFSKDLVEAVDQHEVQTNYLFRDNSGKILHSVQTKGIEFTYENDYEIRYSQLKEYSELRGKFGFATDKFTYK